MHGHPDLEYLSTTQLYRPGHRNMAIDPAGCGWDTPIEHLLAAGYSFIPGSYNQDGCLFRGIESGLRAALAGECFGWFDGVDEMSRVEKAMGIWFLSSEISDALTVSRLHEQPADGGVLAIPATLFNDRLDRGEAAVLAVGDGGMVFRYPLLTRPLATGDAACIFTSPAFEPDRDEDPEHRIVTLTGTTRAELEQELASHLIARGLPPASSVPARSYPRRHHNRLTGMKHE